VNDSSTAISISTRVTHYWLPVLLMLMVQFTFSTGSFSSEETSKVVIPFLTFPLHRPTSDQLLFWHHVVRKAAHVTEYCILGILVYRAFRSYTLKPANVRLLTMLFIAGAATMDEFHQSFVPSRGPSIFDVGWDCIGGLTAMLLLWIWRAARAVEE
jgi:VanZ family protein